jgi:hypothetical protein
VCGALLALPATAGTCAAKSGARTVTLIELYTSEGCDSCPPADRWLASTFPVGMTSPDAIPLAFHVDYWDRLGWKDRFAESAWTERQHAAARANRLRFVYTPQVLVQGRDFPAWRGAAADVVVAATATKAPRASIALAADNLRGAIVVQASARVPGSAERRGTALYVALTESGLVSKVTAGENAGALLQHDHVVRALHGGVAVDANGDAAAQLTLPLPRESGMATTLVAFVQNVVTGDVLQALALPVADALCVRPR